MSRPEVIMPRVEPATIIPEKSALLVLDMSERCADPKLPSHGLAREIIRFLDRAREVGILTIFTVSASLKGAPEGQVYSFLKRRPSEAVISPDGFDKFAGGALQTFLSLYDIDTLVITGYRSNIAVLHTATKAARELKYKVVIPTDGIAALTDYEHEYALFHFTVLPAQAAKLFTFTKLDMINFERRI